MSRDTDRPVFDVPTLRSAAVSQLAASLAAAAAIALSPTPAAAETIVVDTVLDVEAADGFCSLREAILSANDDLSSGDCPAGDGPDRIDFELTTPATIVLTDHLPTITAPLAIQGPGALDLTISGDMLYRPIDVDVFGGGTWLLVEDLSLIDARTPVGSDYGGAARVALGETAIFRRVRFIGSRAANAGGGLLVENGGNLTVEDCLFEGNVAEGAAGAGGLYADGPDTVTVVRRSAFVRNRTEHQNGSGGGIRVQSGVVDIEASTFSGNVANGDGGGIVLAADANRSVIARIRDSTFTANFAANDLAGEGGGGIRIVSGTTSTPTLQLENSVVSGNQDLSGNDSPDISCFGSLVSVTSSSNFVGSNEGCSTFFAAGNPNGVGDYVGTAASALIALLGPLANHGGPTVTHLPSLLPLSPLVDSGSCGNRVTDQRGWGNTSTGSRVVDLAAVANGPGSDGCDIGAVEAEAEEGANRRIFSDGFESGHTLEWTIEIQP